jgi:hypothetical protein
LHVRVERYGGIYARAGRTLCQFQNEVDSVKIVKVEDKRLVEVQKDIDSVKIMAVEDGSRREGEESSNE